MAKLIYAFQTSLDGYVADENGNFDWTTPDEEVASFINDREMVYSTTLPAVSAPRTRLERKFDAGAVLKLQSEATRDIGIGCPALAAQAIRARLVDEYHRLIVPIIVGGGNRYLPEKVRVKLELLDERTFGNGMVHLRYRAKG